MHSSQGNGMTGVVDISEDLEMVDIEQYVTSTPPGRSQSITRQVPAVTSYSAHCSLLNGHLGVSNGDGGTPKLCCSLSSDDSDNTISCCQSEEEKLSKAGTQRPGGSTWPPPPSVVAATVSRRDGLGGPDPHGNNIQCVQPEEQATSNGQVPATPVPSDTTSASSGAPGCSDDHYDDTICYRPSIHYDFALNREDGSVSNRLGVRLGDQRRVSFVSAEAEALQEGEYQHRNPCCRNKNNNNNTNNTPNIYAQLKHQRSCSSTASNYSNATVITRQVLAADAFAIPKRPLPPLSTNNNPPPLSRSFSQMTTIQVHKHRCSGSSLGRGTSLGLCLLVTGATGSFFFNWPATQQLVLRSGAYSWLCMPATGIQEKQASSTTLSLRSPQVWTDVSKDTDLYGGGVGYEFLDTADGIWLPKQPEVGKLSNNWDNDKTNSSAGHSITPSAFWNMGDLNHRLGLLLRDVPMTRVLLEKSDNWKWNRYMRSSDNQEIADNSMLEYQQTSSDQLMKSLLQSPPDNPSISATTVTTCLEQIQAINSLMPIGIATWFFFSFVGGVAVDFYGPKLISMTGLFMSASGWILLSACSEDFPFFAVAFSFIGCGVDVIFIGLLNIANLFPGYRSTIVSLFNASRSVSFAIPSAITVAIDGFPSLLTFDIASLLYAIFVLAWTVIVFIIVPWEAYPDDAVPDPVSYPDTSTRTTTLGNDMENDCGNFLISPRKTVARPRSLIAQTGFGAETPSEDGMSSQLHHLLVGSCRPHDSTIPLGARYFSSEEVSSDAPISSGAPVAFESLSTLSCYSPQVVSPSRATYCSVPNSSRAIVACPSNTESQNMICCCNEDRYSDLATVIRKQPASCSCWNSTPNNETLSSNFYSNSISVRSDSWHPISGSTGAKVVDGMPEKCSSLFLRFRVAMSLVKAQSFWPIIPYAIFTVVRGSFLSNSANDQLVPFVNLFAILTPLSFIPAPLFGLMADRISINFVFLVLNTLGTIQFVCLVLAPHSHFCLALVTVMNLLISSFFLGQIYCYITVTFPSAYSGTLIGLTISLSGLFGLLVTPMYNYSTNTKNFQLMNCLCLGFCLAGYICIYLLWTGSRHQHSEFAPASDQHCSPPGDAFVASAAAVPREMVPMSPCL